MNDQTELSGNQKQRYKCLLKCILVLLFSGLSGLFIPMCGLPLIFTILLLYSASTARMKEILKIAIMLFAFGALSTLIIRQTIIWPFTLSLPYVVVPSLAMVISLRQACDKSVSNRFTHIILFSFIFLFFIFNLRTYLVMASPYFYMPPALNNNNVKVFKECIEYIKNHEEFKNLVFNARGRTSDNNLPSDPNIRESLYKKLRRISIEPKNASIANQIRNIMCSQFERYDDIVIFYKGNNPFIPMTAQEIWHVWPSGHGVAYSLNGRNPNQSNDPVLEKYKPFIKIRRNWYLSRDLLMIGNGRTYSSISPINKTLIDRSLLLKAIDLNELDDPNL